jgi:hypothetical protein
MLPCCIFGALLIVQALGFTRWFRRFILRKPPKPGEDELWSPERASLRERMRRVATGRGRTRVAIVAVLGEVAVFAVVYAVGGFEIIGHLLGHHGH